jgi:hypothetical protein
MESTCRGKTPAFLLSMMRPASCSQNFKKGGAAQGLLYGVFLLK